MEAIYQLKQLKYLSIGDDEMEDSDILPISQLSNLTFLSVEAMGVQSEGAKCIGKLENLKYLDISDSFNMKEDDLRQKLGNLKKLEWLTISQFNLKKLDFYSIGRAEKNV